MTVNDTYQSKIVLVCMMSWRLINTKPSPNATVIYTFSGYKYTLISEWTRLFGLLRILDNLICGAVCYFCTTVSVFCEIYTLRMRVVAHAAILWVVSFLCRRPELGLCICPHQWPLGHLVQRMQAIEFTSTTVDIFGNCVRCSDNIVCYCNNTRDFAVSCPQIM